MKAKFMPTNVLQFGSFCQDFVKILSKMTQSQSVDSIELKGCLGQIVI